MTNKEKLKSISTPADEDWLKIAEDWEMADSFEEFVVLAGVNNNTTEYNTAKTFWLQSAREQKKIDIETIPQLYVRWLMIEGEKPSWEEYANKTIEE